MRSRSRPTHGCMGNSYGLLCPGAVPECLTPAHLRRQLIHSPDARNNSTSAKSSPRPQDTPIASSRHAHNRRRPLDNGVTSRQVLLRIFESSSDEDNDHDAPTDCQSNKERDPGTQVRVGYPGPGDTDIPGHQGLDPPSSPDNMASPPPSPDHYRRVHFEVLPVRPRPGSALLPAQVSSRTPPCDPGITEDDADGEEHYTPGDNNRKSTPSALTIAGKSATPAASLTAIVELPGHRIISKDTFSTISLTTSKTITPATFAVASFARPPQNTLKNTPAKPALATLDDVPSPEVGVIHAPEPGEHRNSVTEVAAQDDHASKDSEVDDDPHCISEDEDQVGVGVDIDGDIGGDITGI